MRASAAITVLVADDHPLVLRGISDLLEAEPDLRIEAECTNGLDALARIRAVGPAVAVLDLAMPGLSGLEVLKRVRAERLACSVVMLTASITDAKLLDAVASGVSGILLKDAAPDELVQCIREVAGGHRWISQDLVDAALQRENARRSAGRILTDGLTQREREVMLLVADGLSNKEVGRRLNLSDGTVKIHLHNIYQKTGVGNRTALTAAAVSQRNELDR